MAENEKPVDLGDPDQVAAKQQKSQTRDKRIQNGLNQVLSHPDSRLWLFSMLEDAGPFHDPFATNSSLTSYQCGKQAWARRLTATMLDSHADSYRKMMLENAQG